MLKYQPIAFFNLNTLGTKLRFGSTSSTIALIACISTCTKGRGLEE